MRLLFLSFYYPPDLSAGSFRARSLIEALAPYRSGDLHVDLVTTMPNRYHGLNRAAQQVEHEPGLQIYRVFLPTHRSGMLDQSRAFGVYARAVLRHVASNDYDAVFATSSRLMTAVLATRIARTKSIPLYLDIRDLFTDTISDLFANSRLKPAVPLFQRIERWSFGSADRISIVSEGFFDHVRRVAPSAEIKCFTNGIDDEFLKADFSASQQRRDQRPLILYAGNIGEGQGLDRILPQASELLANRARFRIVGAGGRGVRLLETLSSNSNANVEILPPVPRSELHAHYKEADILFLHLNSYPAFHKVLPSKIFEYGATGKPIIAGVAGAAARFVQKNLSHGAEVFAPCDAAGMVRAFDAISQLSDPADRTAFRTKFSRRVIMQEMADDLLNFLADARSSRRGLRM